MSNDWGEFKTQIIEDIRNSLKNRDFNDKIKSHSLIKAQNTLNNIEKYFEYNKGEFFYKKIFLMRDL